MSCRGLLVVVVLLAVSILAPLKGVRPWRSDRRPRVYGNRIPHKHLTPIHKHVQAKIVLYHNYFRKHVKPSAKDMLLMKWHSGAASAAQRWAQECRLLHHDNITGRWIDKYGSCGQNIFVSTHQVPWYFAVETWYLEKNNFTYGASDNDLSLVGHFTQLVWSATHQVGCGFHRCEHGVGAAGKARKSYFAYVCNYCPIGNHIERLGRPYAKGRHCSSCPKHCKKGLCTNFCPAADLWANCKDLFATWPNWLCRTNTEQGKQRRQFCRATCRCRNRIT